MYGLTELAGRFCVNANAQKKENYGAVGKPIPGMEVKILDDDNTELPIGEIGRVVASGRCMFSGYLKDQQINDRVFSDLGFDTGDLGVLNEEGYIFHKGRSDDVFKSGGLKVSIVPIIEALMNTGFFEDIAVIPVPHEDRSRVPHVFYVLKDGVEFKKGKVLKPLRQELPGNSIPHGFTQVERVPRTGSGKVARGELRKLLGL
jgi:acyl-CoA synthetase (AMP-forming)/AMP-acid ligase II